MIKAKGKLEIHARSFRWLAVLVAVIVVVGCGGDDEDNGNVMMPTNNSPVASIAASGTQVPAGDNFQTILTLDGSGSSDADGDSLSYSWTVPGGRFENGSLPTDAIIDVSFPGIVPYTVTLTVSDGRGGTGQASVTITVGP